MNRELTAIKQEHPYLKEAFGQSLCHTLGNLAKAFTNLKAGRARAPKFKSRFSRQSIGYPQGCKMDNGRVYLPKAGWIRFRGQSDGSNWNGKTVTVSLDTDGSYWMSYNYEVQCPKPKPVLRKNTLGLDLGIKDMVATSHGRKLNPDDIIPNFTAHDQRLESRVEHYQTHLSLIHI